MHMKAHSSTPLVPTRSVLAAALACGLGLPLQALAELSNDSMIGPGLRVRPAYDGSSSRYTELVPVIRYLGQPIFVRSTQGVLEGGARMALAPGLHAGVQLAYESGRKASDSDLLRTRGFSDISRGASIGAQVEWDTTVGPAPVTLLGRVRQNSRSGLGAQADARLSVGVFRSGLLSAGVFAQGIWANARSNGAYYGVTPAQSAASGLPAYNAGSGLQSGSLGLLWSVHLAPSWDVLGSMEARRLYGDAARSPLTERKTNFYASAGVAYRF
jgi:outer membrane scaffolding protein for murein synthesis (MipA/OmpV family)